MDKTMMTDMGENDAQDQQDQTPLDGIIATVDSYIKDPKLVTPETLTSLKSDLEDLKSYLDSEETKSGESQDSGDSGKPSLTVMIGAAKKGKGY